MAVIINESRCTGCGVCVALCKPGALMLDQGNAPDSLQATGDSQTAGDSQAAGSRAVWSAGNCVHCGLCEFYCKEQAITMIISADSRISK